VAQTTASTNQKKQPNTQTLRSCCAKGLFRITTEKKKEKQIKQKIKKRKIVSEVA